MNEPRYVSEAREKAAAVRHHLSLGFEAVANIFHLLEEAGLPVVKRDMGQNGPDGIYANDGKLAVTFINTAMRSTRQRFTAAHEFGHHLFDAETGLRLDEDIFVAEDIREKRANSFAATFLMPEEGIRKLLQTNKKRRLDPHDVVHLSYHFRVSKQALIFQLHNIGLISAAERDRFMEMNRKNELYTIMWEMGYVRPLREDRGHVDLLLPPDYVRRAIRAYTSAEISLERLAELLKQSDVAGLQQELEAANLFPPAEQMESLLEDVERA